MSNVLWKNRNMLKNLMAIVEDIGRLAYYVLRVAGRKVSEVRAAIESRKFTPKEVKGGSAGSPLLALDRLSPPSLAFLWGRFICEHCTVVE